MFEIISIITAFVGSGIASIFDLKTTEIPDKIPYAMILIALILHGIQSIIQWNYKPFLNSLISGISLLAFGFVMYRFGQWGGGDAKILSAIGFLIPEPPSGFSSLLLPFPASYLINVFLVGSIYMLFYAFVFSLINRRIFYKFVEDIKASREVLSIGSFALLFSFLFINFLLSTFFNLSFDFIFFLKSSFLLLFLTLFLFTIWRFTKAVEDFGFKKRIHVSKLKVGDVLLKSKLWEGITEKELKKIRRSGKKFIYIKEGVRFAPSFPLALFFTLFFGDVLLVFMKILM
ncbi:MAG: A24 family peptidase [Candidatus Aenigmatarchaeota archaeon]